MPAAARILDVTNHGGTITGPGDSTVLIGGIPASVMGDNHMCAIPANTPHPQASAFVVGSGTVLIGGKPAIRVGDTCICGAAPAVGEITVLIG